MKIVVLGANGRTGVHVVRLALERGARVTAVVRSESKRPNILHDNLHVAVGDPCDPAFLTDVFQNYDAVISTLGGRLPTKRATSIYFRSAEAIAKAAKETGVSSIVVTSSALLFSSDRLLDRLLSVVVPNVVRSALRMEAVLMSTKFNARIARCGFLTDSDETRYRALEDSLPENGSSVARLSLAHFLMDSLNEPWSGYQVFGVSCPGNPER